MTKASVTLKDIWLYAYSNPLNITAVCYLLVKNLHQWNIVLVYFQIINRYILSDIFASSFENMVAFKHNIKNFLEIYSVYIYIYIFIYIYICIYIYTYIYIYVYAYIYICFHSIYNLIFSWGNKNSSNLN